MISSKASPAFTPVTGIPETIEPERRDIFRNFEELHEEPLEKWGYVFRKSDCEFVRPGHAEVTMLMIETCYLRPINAYQVKECREVLARWLHEVGSRKTSEPTFQTRSLVEYEQSVLRVEEWKDDRNYLRVDETLGLAVNARQ